MFMLVEFCGVKKNPEAYDVDGNQKSGEKTSVWMVLKPWYIMGQLGGGFKYLLFSPLPGKMIQFD